MKAGLGSAAGQLLARPTILLAGSSVIAAVVGLAVSAAVSRLYSPAEVGGFAVFASVVALMAPYATLRMATALPLLKHERTAATLAVGCMGVAVLAGAAAVPVAAALLPAATSRADETVPLLWLMAAPAVTGTGVYETLVNWSLRTGAIRQVAASRVQQSVLGGCAKVGLGLVGSGMTGLAVGHVVSVASGIRPLWLELRPALEKACRRMTARRAASALFSQRSYVGYRLPSQSVLSFATQAPLLLMEQTYGPDVAGQLAMTLATLAAASGIITTSVSMSHYSRSAMLGSRNRAELFRSSRSIVLRLLGVGLLPATVLWLAGPKLFGAYLGQQWEQAGAFAASLAPMALLQFVAMPIMGVLGIIGANRLFLLLNCARLGTVVVVFGAAGLLSLNPDSAIRVLGLSLAAYFGATTMLVLAAIARWSPNPLPGKEDAES